MRCRRVRFVLVSALALFVITIHFATKLSNKAKIESDYAALNTAFIGEERLEWREDEPLEKARDWAHVIRWHAQQWHRNRTISTDRNEAENVSSKNMHQESILDRVETKLYGWLDGGVERLLRREFGEFERAIVMSAYDAAIDSTLTSLAFMRRHLNVTLPFILVSIDSVDLNIRNKKLISQLENVHFVMLQDVIPRAQFDIIRPLSFAAKPFSLLFAPCRQCLFLDSDAFLLTHPETLFNNDKFLKSGALFFLDRQLLNPNVKRTEWLRSVLPRPDLAKKSLGILSGEQEQQQDSGMILVDKSRTWTLFGLLATCALNAFPLRHETYSYVYGDKETFWLGMEIVGAPYEFNNVRPGIIGRKENVFFGLHQRVYSGQMVHISDADGKTLLWFNGGLTKNKYAKTKHTETAVLTHWMCNGTWDLGDDDYFMTSYLRGWLSWMPWPLGSPVYEFDDATAILMKNLIELYDYFRNRIET